MEESTTPLAGAQRFGDWLRQYSDWVMGIGVLGLMVTLIWLYLLILRLLAFLSRNR